MGVGAGEQCFENFEDRVTLKVAIVENTHWHLTTQGWPMVAAGDVQ